MKYKFPYTIFSAQAQGPTVLVPKADANHGKERGRKRAVFLRCRCC